MGKQNNNTTDIVPYHKFQDGTYQNGGKGFIEFVEDNIWTPIYPIGEKVKRWWKMGELPDIPHPETGRSYKGLWEKHKEVAREALRMENGEFLYRLIILCWMRGDGKSFLVVLIVIWKFICFPDQKIALSANSKDQSKFVHFDDMRTLINNSPNLLAILGEKNIRDKEIRMRDQAGNVVSTIQSVSSFTGVLSNITGFTFSEFFLMQNEKFFNEIDTSMRNVPNAFGLIDTTVSPKSHVLYRLYEAWRKGEDDTLFFSYRMSKEANPKDFWHPYNTEKQLKSYKTKYPLTFDKFFKNLWSAGADKVFSPAQVESIYYIGAYNNLMRSHSQVVQAIARRISIEEGEQKLKDAGLDGKRYDHHYSADRELAEIEKMLWPADKEYRMVDTFGEPRGCTIDELVHLGKLYDTDWAILTGLDRADPMKRRSKARTIVTVVAKGLPGSRSNPYMGTLTAPKYLYVMLNLVSVHDHSLEGIKEVLNKAHGEFDGVDTFCSERYGAWDLKDWCEQNGTDMELLQGNYNLQLAAFTELYNLVDEGRFKSARVHVPGSRGADILKEEMTEFDHDDDTKWFGSPEKTRKHGIQDDVMFALSLTIYGGRFKSVDDFHPRSGNEFFGAFFPDPAMVGRY
jgi:hypothetical protein